MRGVAPHFWNQEYEPGISICQFIDNLNLDFLIKQCNLTIDKHRERLDSQEVKTSLLVLKLKITHGGLGLVSTSCNVGAWIGSWGAIGGRVLSTLGDITYLKSDSTDMSYAYVPSDGQKPIPNMISSTTNLAALPTGRRTIDALDL